MAAAANQRHRRNHSSLFLRILLPFSLLLAVSLGGFLAIALISIDHSLKTEADSRLQHIAELLARSPYLANKTVLAQMAHLTRMDFLVIDADNTPMFATIADSDLLAAAAALSPTVPTGFSIGDTKFLALSRPLSLAGNISGRLLVLVDQHQQQELLRSMLRRFLLLGFALLLVVAGLAYLLALSISRPLAELAALAPKIACGIRSHCTAIGGSDEIDRLGGAINTMIDDLARYEVSLVENEKLATAGRMATALSHEIKNPLTAIKMFIQVLKGRLRDQEENHRMLDTVQREIDRLAQIVDQIGDHARISAITTVPADLPALVNEVLSLAAEMLRRQHITVVRENFCAAPPLPLDQDKIRQVCWNLILNARDAMADGGTLTVSLTCDEESVSIRFADSGRGLPDLNPEELLSPFTTTKPDGLGLGLSTSRQIVEAHNGTLTLTNGADGGATAIIVLPIAPTSTRPSSQ